MDWFVEAEEGVQVAKEDESLLRQRGIEIFEGAKFDGAAKMMRGGRDRDGHRRRIRLWGRVDIFYISLIFIHLLIINDNFTIVKRLSWEKCSGFFFKSFRGNFFTKK